MRKKHEKIVLKSDVFKTKTPQKSYQTPSRSPISRSPYLTKKQQDRVDANDLFQKVCCPNCRFIFKIIKHAEVLAASPPRKKEKAVSQATQTEEMMLKDGNQLKNLSSQLSKRLSQRNDSLLTKSMHLKPQMEQIVQQQSQSDVKEDSFKLIDMAASKTNNNNLLNTNNRSSMKSSLKLGEKHSSQSSFMIDQVKTSRNQEELKQIIGKLYLSSKASQALNIMFKELPVSIEFPAYHKMLLSEGPEERH